MTISGRAGLGAALLLMALSATAAATSYRDAVGREVDVPPRPARIVSLAPNLTEILFALGLNKEVAGVTSFCDWPPEARTKPKVGGFINPSLEAVLALDPELVLATADGNRAEDVARLEALGVAVFTVDTRSLDDITDSITVIGRLTGRAERAERVVGDMNRRKKRVWEAVQGRPALSVFVALDRSPLVTAGKGTFVDELVSLAGGSNIVDSPTVKYPVYSMEQLVASDPAVIVEATGPAPAARGEALAWWRSLPGGERIRAVREERVFQVGEGDFFRPGPRIIDSLERLAAMFHPEAPKK